VQSPVNSEGSVMCGHHSNVVIHITNSEPSASWFMYGGKGEMDNLNCCFGGRFPLIL